MTKNGGAMKESIAFCVMNDSSVFPLKGFGDIALQEDKSPVNVNWLPPQPCLNSNFTLFEGFTEQQRCFVIVKVHEVRELIEGTPHQSSTRQLVSFLDMSGNVRRATVWPPLCRCQDFGSKTRSSRFLDAPSR